MFWTEYCCAQNSDDLEVIAVILVYQCVPVLCGIIYWHSRAIFRDKTVSLLRNISRQLHQATCSFKGSCMGLNKNSAGVYKEQCNDKVDTVELPFENILFHMPTRVL